VGAHVFGPEVVWEEDFFLV